MEMSTVEVKQRNNKGKGDVRIRTAGQGKGSAVMETGQGKGSAVMETGQGKRVCCYGDTRRFCMERKRIICARRQREKI
jgi:hypothetical protein